MVLTGTIEAGELLRIAPANGDRVLMFSNVDGRWVADGTVSYAGQFMLLANRLAPFNGTPVVLELQQGRKRYALVQADGGRAWLPYAGRLLPERTTLRLRLGPQTAELPATQESPPQAQRLSRRVDLPCDSQSDVDEDGRCDEADGLILQRYAGGVSRSVGRP
jgi:hypothetical protein